VWDNCIKALELVCGAARDRTWAKDIRIKGQHFLKGIVMAPGDGKTGYSASEVVVACDITPGSEYIDFVSKVALADPSCDPAGGSTGSVEVVAEAELEDEKTEKESRVIRRGDESDVKIRVVGSKKLTLKVNNLDEDNHCDHAVWANAAFTTF
jgi:hypothetical protein